jgi:hypothetical protein
LREGGERSGEREGRREGKGREGEGNGAQQAGNSTARLVVAECPFRAAGGVADWADMGSKVGVAERG